MANRNKKFILNLFLLFAFFLSAENVFAACTNPARNAGAREYFTAENKYKYCDGTNWQRMQDGGLQLIASVSGTAHANFSTANTAIVSGSYAYATGTGKFTIVDVTDSTAPRFVSMLSLSTIGNSMAIKGNYAFVAMTSNAGIHVIDFTNKNNPVIVGSLTDVANLQYIVKIIGRGNYLYVLATNKLSIVDISTPTAPVVVGSYTNATTLAGGNSLDYSNDFVIVASMTYDGISIIDVSNKAAPTQVGFLTDARMDGAADVKINGNYAYVGAFAVDTIAAIDITNKAAPVIVTSLASTTYFDNLRTMEIKDDLLFVGAQPASSTNPTLSTVDISLPASPVILANNNPGREHHPYSFSVSGDKFIALSSLGGRIMLIYDLTPLQTIQSQASMFAIGTLKSNAGVATSGNLAVHLDTDEVIQVFDITSATAMIARGSVYIPTGTNRSANSLAFDGSYAYSGHGNDSRIVITDVATDVNKPTVVSSLTLGGQPQGLYISGNYLYVAGSNGLTIVDVTTKSNPVIVGNVTLGGTARAVNVVGNYAYVVIPTLDKLSVVNVTTKSAPVVSIEVADSTNTDFARSIDIYGNYAYVLSGPDFGSGRITTYNISNPVSPTFSASFTHANFGNPSQIKVNPAGTNLYLLGFSLCNVSLSNPAVPAFAGASPDVDGDHTGGLAVVSGAVLIGSVQDDYSLQAFSTATSPVLVRKHYGLNYISSTAGITASGTYTYVSSVSAVTSVNISDPNNPTIASSIIDGVRLQTVQKIAVEGSKLFAVGSNYITTLSISNPTSLTILGHLTDAPNLASAKTIKVVGNYAFVGGNKLSVLDISGVNPVHVTSLTHATISNCGGMEISGNNLYLLCASTNTFLIIDISTPTAPVIINAFTNSNLSGAYGSMAIMDNAAFIARPSPTVVNLTNPLSLSTNTLFPVTCTTFTKTSSPKRIICSTSNSVRTYDITDQYDYLLVSSVRADRSFLDTIVHGNLLLSAVIGGIHIGNLSSVPLLGAPKRFGGDIVLAQARGIDVVNNKAYVTTGTGYLNIFDVSNTASATLLSSKYFGDSNFFNVASNIANIHITGNYAHITGGAQRGNIVIDITDSTNPIKISQYTHPSLGWQNNGATRYYNGHGYAGSTAAGFGSFDITSGTTGVQKGFLTHANINTPYGIDFSGNHAFICSSGTNGLTAVNISNPSAPTYAGTLVDATRFAGCRSVVVSGSYAYVVGVTSGYFTAVDISNPAAMTIAGSIVSSTVFGTTSNDITISGTTVYHSNPSRLSSIDISSPASPTILDTFVYSTNPSSYFMKVHEDKLFVANHSTPGLTIYSIKQPTALGVCSTAGVVDFDSTINVWKYCNGTNYYAFTENGAGGAGCSSPTGKKGELEYDTAKMNYRYCDGANWKQIGPSTN